VAISVPTSSLTVAGRTATIAKRKAAGDAYTKAIARRRQMAAALNASRKAVPGSTTWLARYRSAVAAEKAAKGRYGTEQAYYKQFGGDFNRFMALAKQNPDLQGTLSKLTPYDPASAAERLGAQHNLNSALTQIKQGRDQLGEDYSTAGRQMETDQGDRFRALLNNFAGRGMAFSSGYGQSYGTEQADYTRRRTDLDTTYKRGMAQADLDTGQAQSGYQAQLAAILANTTGRLSANAGQLGLAGQKDLPLLLEVAKRRLTASGG
jgi:hypothetical protein